MKRIPWSTAFLGLVAIGTAGLLPACGGTDTSSSGGGGAGTTTTTTPSGGTGGGETTTTAAPGLPDGSPCTTNDECEGSFCISQMEYGWPYGYCTGACNSLIPCADPASICVEFSVGGLCMKVCDAVECGQGQSCVDPGDGTSKFCVYGCTKDEECAGYGKCDVATGACYVPEDCMTPGDEDSDGLSDCEDSDCATGCQAQIGAACAAAVAMDLVTNATTTKNGDTTNGSSLFAGFCSGSSNNENIYKVTNTTNADGVVELKLTSAEDLAIYARGECGMTSDLSCADGLAGGADPEVLNLPLAKGASFYVFVDGSSFDGNPHMGAYALTGNLLGVQVETEPNNDGPMPGPSTANAVNISALPALPAGSLDQATDNDDWFVIDTSALAGNKTITVESIGYGGDSCAPTGDVDTVVQIVDGMGAVLNESDDISGFTNWCSLATIADQPPAKYYVHTSVSTLCTPDPMGPDCKFKYALKISIE